LTRFRDKASLVALDRGGWFAVDRRGMAGVDESRKPLRVYRGARVSTLPTQFSG
jgi:hypothetical protein